MNTYDQHVRDYAVYLLGKRWSIPMSSVRNILGLGYVNRM